MISSKITELTAADVMIKDLETLPFSAKLSDALQIMVENHVTALPIVDRALSLTSPIMRNRLAIALLLAACLTSATPAQEVEFARHISPMLYQLGCSAGQCHGSFSGKGGFRLSLFGYEPEKDFVAITRDSSARRINPTSW